MRRRAPVFSPWIALAVMVPVLMSGPVAAQVPPPEEVNRAIESAARLAAQRRFAAAESILTGVLSTTPDHAGALYQFATVLSWDGRYVESIATYRRLLAVQPGNRGLHLEIARVLLWQSDSRGQPNAALAAAAECESMLTYEPDNRIALKQSAAIDMRFRRFRQALPRLERAVRAQPGDAEAARLQAECWRGLRKHERAIGTLHAFLQSHPQAAELRWSLADMMVSRGRLDEAALEYTRILQQAPAHAGAHVGLGRILIWKGHRDESREHFLAAASLRPRSADPILGLAELEAAGGRWRHAADFYRKASELDPASRVARSGEAQARWEAGSGLATDYGRFVPSSGLTREWVRTSFDFRVMEPLQLSLASTRWNFESEAAPVLHRQDYAVAMTSPIGRRLRFSAQFTYGIVGDPAATAPGLVGGFVGINAAPSSRVSAFFNLERAPFAESYATVRPGYRSDALAAGAGWSPVARLSLEASGQFARRSGVFSAGYWNGYVGRWIVLGDLPDRSEQHVIDGRASWQITSRPPVRLGYIARTQTARYAAGLPYWAPESYWQHGPAASLANSWSLGAVGARGEFTQSKDGSGWGWSGSAWASARWGVHVEVVLSGSYSRAASQVPWDGRTIEGALRWRP